MRIFKSKAKVIALTNMQNSSVYAWKTRNTSARTKTGRILTTKTRLYGKVSSNSWKSNVIRPRKTSKRLRIASRSPLRLCKNLSLTVRTRMSLNTTLR